MPTTVPDSRELRHIIHFTPSAAYELLLSLGTVYWKPLRHQDWAERARAALGADVLAEIRYFYDELWHPLVLMELPVDYPGAPDDVAGFIDYVAGMDGETFLFYLWGRIIPREDIPELQAHPDQVPARIFAFYENHWPGTGANRVVNEKLIEVAADPGATQARLVDLLRTYYRRVFKAEVPTLRPIWAASLEDKRQALAQSDPPVFLNRLVEGRNLPGMFPEGTPLREIRVVPSFYIWRSNFEIWGYGSLVVVYNASHTEQRAEARAATVERLSQIAAALADTNRLKILSQIVQEPESYGHKLARYCGISQPAVSRHMGILKRAGLVEEVPRDGRVAYRLCRPVLEEFIPDLLHYLED